MIIVRNYKLADIKILSELFYNTVHTVNAKDYTPNQLNAWASGRIDRKAWNKSFEEHYTLVAEIDGKIVGFGDIDDSGYLDRLYVHKDYQGQGIATAICDRLEEHAKDDITVHASITAKPFFEGRGYAVVKEQEVERDGILLTNYKMMKKRGECDE